MRELHADLKSSRGNRRVLGSRGRRQDLVPGEVLPGDAFDLGRGREVDWRLGAFGGALQEQLAESDDDRRATHGEVRADDARMARIHRDPGALEAPRELLREQDLGELCLPVTTEATVAAFALGGIYLESPAPVATRCPVTEAE